MGHCQFSRAPLATDGTLKRAREQLPQERAEQRTEPFTQRLTHSYEKLADMDDQAMPFDQTKPPKLRNAKNFDQDDVFEKTIRPYNGTTTSSAACIPEPKPMGPLSPLPKKPSRTGAKMKRMRLRVASERALAMEQKERLATMMRAVNARREAWARDSDTVQPTAQITANPSSNEYHTTVKEHIALDFAFDTRCRYRVVWGGGRYIETLDFRTPAGRARAVEWFEGPEGYWAYGMDRVRRGLEKCNKWEVNYYAYQNFREDMSFLERFKVVAKLLLGKPLWITYYNGASFKNLGCRSRWTDVLDDK